jgi:hypothetical protein
LLSERESLARLWRVLRSTVLTDVAQLADRRSIPAQSEAAARLGGGHHHRHSRFVESYGACARHRQEAVPERADAVWGCLRMPGSSHWPVRRPAFAHERRDARVVRS